MTHPDAQSQQPEEIGFSAELDSGQLRGPERSMLLETHGNMAGMRARV